MRSKADETFVIVETLICPLHISHKIALVCSKSKTALILHSNLILVVP